MINKNSKFVVIDACNSNVLHWFTNSCDACKFSKEYSKAYCVTTCLITLQNRLTKLFKFDGKESLWLYPGEVCTDDVAVTLPKNIFTNIIVDDAYSKGMSSEWVKSTCGKLYVNG